MKLFSKLKRSKNVINGKDNKDNNAELESCSIENTPKFSFQTNGKVPCKVLNVYDGDTIDIAMKHDGNVSAFKVRLAGIDTPELKPGKDVANRQNIIESGISAKDFLQNMVFNKILPIEIIGQEKYGRLLGKLYIDRGTNVSVNDILVLSGHAKVYDGGKKSE